MIFSFSSFKLKDKASILLVLLFLCFSIYFYLNHLQRNYNSAQWSGERCVSELTSIKYQLNVVTEYKNRLDKQLTETQKAHSLDKQRFKDIIDSCVALKQQTLMCQSQFEDLQSECRKVKEDYDKLQNKFDKFMSHR